MKATDNKQGIAYGSIYLDDGENPEEMLDKQIKHFVNNNKGIEIKFVFFDIIGEREHVDLLMAVRGYCQQEIMARMELDVIQVYVATGFEENQRPARDIATEYLK